jgi:hypothetical protein
MARTLSAARLAIASLGFILSMACGFADATAQPTSPLAAALPPISTLAPIVSATPRQPVARTSLPKRDQCDVPETGAAIHYRVSAQIDPEARTVRAALRAAYRNRADVPLDALVLFVDPNHAEGAFSLETLGSAPESAVRVVGYTLERAQLTVRLEQPLPIGCRAVLELTFTLRVPSLSKAHMKYFSYTERQLNLGHWLPEFAPRLRGAWAVPRAWRIGEYIFSEQADFEAEIVLSGTSPADLIAPGEVERLGDRNWRVRFLNGRSLPLVISAHMARLSAQTANGETIDLYYFETSSGAPSAAHLHALQTARQAVERFTQLFGNMLYDRLVVCAGDDGARRVAVSRRGACDLCRAAVLGGRAS